MKNYTEKIRDHINEILVKNIDAQQGFEQAVQHTKSSSLKSYFQKRSTERKKIVSDLKAELSHYGEQCENAGSVSAKVHRSWMDIKAVFSNDNDDKMLEDSMRAEKSVLNEYEEALTSGDIPESTATLLRSQKGKIQNSMKKIRAMEDIQ